MKIVPADVMGATQPWAQLGPVRYKRIPQEWSRSKSRSKLQ
jgi:hypothetical protein